VNNEEEEELRGRFFELTSDHFPFVVEFFRLTDRDGVNPIHRIEVTGAGAVEVPRLGNAKDGLVWVRTIFANGKIRDSREVLE